jgi:maltose alpha-D-glucosyltransferase/alpha-amylase
MPDWLKDAVFYEIYPQSFYDANGDGIGDIEGIIQKLEYIKYVGCNALWINPCFDSPFKDAGYDVRDYKKAAGRYGTNDDLKRLFACAREKGIRVLLDLVPGHTSEEHEWFKESAKAHPAPEYRNRYIWTDHPFGRAEGLGFIGGETERPATYGINFFKSQPALNFGFFKPSAAWQLPIDHPDCIATREAVKDIMRFWLDSGCDGFRVDMAGSLVKHDDAEKSGTQTIWRDIRAMLDAEYPEAALVAEWSYPRQAIAGGFHMDFFLNFGENAGGYRSLLRDYQTDEYNNIVSADTSFFKKDGNHDIRRFLDEYLYHYRNTRDKGFISLVTGNHDSIRVRYTLEPDELALAYAFIFTMPGVPFLYYGDEIGMRYLNIPTKEGGYFRTGSRTPMQWTNGANCGFSTAPADKLYLPVDQSPDAPSVERAKNDPSSLLHTVRAVLKLRSENPDLQAPANLEIIRAEKGRLPFVYKRGSCILAVNPGEEEAEAAVPFSSDTALFSIGACSMKADVCRMGKQSFGVWRI